MTTNVWLTLRVDLLKTRGADCAELKYHIAIIVVMLSPRGQFGLEAKILSSSSSLSSKICARPRPWRWVFVLDMSLNFSFGPCKIVCNASIGNISEFAITYLLSSSMLLWNNYTYSDDAKCCLFASHFISVMMRAIFLMMLYTDCFYLFNTAFSGLKDLSLSSFSSSKFCSRPWPREFVLA